MNKYRERKIRPERDVELMEWLFALCLTTVIFVSISSVIKIVRYYSHYKAGCGVDFSVMDIIIMIAGFPGTLFAGFIILEITISERLAMIKVFSIGKSVKKEVNQ